MWAMRSTMTAGTARPAPSAARQGQLERGHLLAVANQQYIAGQHRVVPGLALDRREPCQLRELVGRRPDQRQLALLRQHQQQVLVGQQEELAVAVASALPLARAVLEVDARQDAVVEAEGMALVNHEVVEVWLQPFRGPALFDAPSGGSVRHRDAARAASRSGADQDVAVSGRGRLHDGDEAWPPVLPEQRAVGVRDTGGDGSAQ